MTDILPVGGEATIDYVALGVPPALAMQHAKTARDVTGACMAAARMDLAANGPLEPGVMRPLADLPGWYVYRAPAEHDPVSGNIREVTLILRDDAVRKCLGFVPDRQIRLPHTYQTYLTEPHDVRS